MKELLPGTAGQLLHFHRVGYRLAIGSQIAAVS
jgi:hypothetical protein